MVNSEGTTYPFCLTIIRVIRRTSMTDLRDRSPLVPLYARLPSTVMGYARKRRVLFPISSLVSEQ